MAMVPSLTQRPVSLSPWAWPPRFLALYCVYVHDKNARAEGATEAEIREAVATAAHVRHWSTVLNGMGYDFEAFKAEVDKMHASN